jgi:hypothetical protein
MTERHNRIMIYGPKADGTYVIVLGRGKAPKRNWRPSAINKKGP